MHKLTFGMHELAVYTPTREEEALLRDALEMRGYSTQIIDNDWIQPNPWTEYRSVPVMWFINKMTGGPLAIMPFEETVHVVLDALKVAHPNLVFTFNEIARPDETGGKR